LNRDEWNTVARKKTVKIPKNYKPTKSEAFMNPVMQKYFHRKLQDWKEEILEDTGTTLEKLKTETVQEADLADRAASETERTVELRTRERARKLIDKIDAAIQRVENSTYGYCEETQEPISIKRLDARPIATLTIEAQELHERHEKTHRDD
jgi:DnaK suppressor protein